MANKQTRITRKVQPKHRAVKPRPLRPLDVAKKDNHAARHEAKKLVAVQLAAEAVERQKQAEEATALALAAELGTEHELEPLP